MQTIDGGALLTTTDVEDYICTELVLEKVGGYEALIQKECTEAFPEILTSCKPLMAEFYVLATALVS